MIFAAQVIPTQRPDVRYSEPPLSAVRFAAFKGKQASLARRANLITGTASVKEENLRRYAEGGAAPKTLDRADQASVQGTIENERSLRQRLCPLPGRQVVVAHGDGDFKTGYRTHQSLGLGRKSLLKQLMDRGPVLLLDEWGTSKYCPCCGAEMEDVPSSQTEEDGERLRRCKTATLGAPCDLMLRCEDGLDRDAVACVNMLVCVYALLTIGTRPPHLQRDGGTQSAAASSRSARASTA